MISHLGGSWAGSCHSIQGSVQRATASASVQVEVSDLRGMKTMSCWWYRLSFCGRVLVAGVPVTAVSGTIQGWL